MNRMAYSEFYFVIWCVCLMASCKFADGGNSIHYQFSVRKLRCIETTIKRLFAKVRDMQQKQTTPSNPPFVFRKDKGLYESDVKLYFHGNLAFYLMREAFSIFDNNMFASSWITSAILEAYRYGNAPKPEEEQIMMAIDAMGRYGNRNSKYRNSVRTFWPQIYNNTLNVWQSTPQNLIDFFKMTFRMNWNETLTILRDLGLKDLANVMKFLLMERGTFLKAFMIPPDFDDTFVNLGVGSLLKEMSADFQQIFSRWKSQNTNITSLFDALRKYAYRPMSKDNRVNSLDPRSYYCFRGFMEMAKRTGRDVALTPTWVQDIGEVRKGYYDGVDMPLNINNVDATVAANVVFGITSSILTGLVPVSTLGDLDLQKIYLNTSSLIAYSIKTHFIGRKDLALLYYPSEIQFYWFVSRTYHQLQTHRRKGPLPPVLEEVRNTFRPVLRGQMTDFLLKKAQHDSSTMVYFDDFLGNGDISIFNKTKKRAEDRLFTTAMAINAFISTWTSYDDTKRKLMWDLDTPSVVIETTTKAVNWLNEHILGWEYKPWNAFFSGSIKGQTTIPFGYPANRVQYLNGTSITDLKRFIEHYDGASIIALQGIPSETWYKDKIKHNPFGIPTPTVFPGYNVRGSVFPFWNSEPYTYAISLSALSKFRNSVLPQKYTVFKKEIRMI